MRSPVIALLSLIAVLPICAQVPQLINYQGRVLAGPTNFNGTGQFKFALVNAGGTITFWSNDGTSTNGSEPTNAVSLGVSNGLYSVLLGDTSIPNMITIPASVFDNSDVRLRVWFNDGTHGSQLLSPDQRIASVGYAVIASNVVDGAITSAKIANGAVGAAQIDSAAVQKRVTGAAPSGQFIKSINADGTVVSGIDQNSGGTVTNVSASSPLSVTNATTTPSIALSGTVGAANGGTGLTTPGSSGNLLQSNGTVWTSAAPSFLTSEVDGVIGNEVTNATNSTLLRSGAGTAASPFMLALNTGNANTWTALQTFGALTASGNTSLNVNSGSSTTNIGTGTTVGNITIGGATNFTVLGSAIITTPGNNNMNLSPGGTGIIVANKELDAYDGVRFASTGDTISFFKNVTATLDFPSTPGGTCSELSVTVTGAQSGDTALLGFSALTCNGFYTAFVSTQDTVQVRFNNPTAVTIDPPSRPFHIIVIR